VKVKVLNVYSRTDAGRTNGNTKCNTGQTTVPIRTGLYELEDYTTNMVTP